ncbi:HNH endonuclease [Streptomyces sp. NBC_01456]|uniref:HNH endonuclease n=1 Tax=Streptomyces sp. NBC_01456 TaxID=2975868 RepID=UPI002E2F5F3B|nr:HNH endonuclease [Streptomyces sp. NBC_01456]
MAVSKRLRYEILRRDNHTCRYCGATAPDAPLRIDHVTPVALGGADTPDNLVTACQDCNSGKSSATTDATVVADVEQSALRWAAAMQQAADNVLRQEEPKVEYRQTFLDQWTRWGTGEGDARKAIELPPDWKASIERFRSAGLPDWAWNDIVDASMGNQKVKNSSKFKYACGIAWNQVTVIQQEARRLLGTGSDAGEGPDELESAVTVGAVALWAYISCRDPEPAERAELEKSALTALHSGEEPMQVIKAGEWAAYFGHATIHEGLEAIAENERRSAETNWRNAWFAATGGQFPDEDSSATFWAHCERLYSAGVGGPEMKTAGFVAGYHLSTVPHYGIDRATLKQAGITSSVERATDIWVTSFRAATDRWPSPAEKGRFAAQLERLRDEGGFLVGDVNGAAVAAGANQEADLYWNLPRQLKATVAAGFPLSKEEV